MVIDVVNLERQEIFQLLRDFPDKESRIIGVINKCDTKQSQSDDWVMIAFYNSTGIYLLINTRYLASSITKTNHSQGITSRRVGTAFEIDNSLSYLSLTVSETSSKRSSLLLKTGKICPKTNSAEIT